MNRDRGSFRSTLLMNYGVVVPVLTAFAAALIFTIWPEALAHSPISFEKRGILHHIWHYTLLLAPLIALYGMFSNHRWKLYIESVGLVAIALAVALNLVAQITLLLEKGQESAVLEGVTGYGIALRFGIVFVTGIRCWVILADPEVTVPAQEGMIEIEDDKEWPA